MYHNYWHSLLTETWKYGLLLIMAISLCSCSKSYRLPAEIIENAVLNGYQVIYSPSNHSWSNGGMVDDRIVFTKHISAGSGSYSEYMAPDVTVYMGTTYEFLENGRLIGYNQHDLKFSEVIYKDGSFNVTELNPKEVEAIFPGLDIVLTSSAQNGVITVKKLPWQTKSFLILNDTPESYYHYSFEDAKNPETAIKSLVTVSKAQELVYSHFGARDKLNPPLFVKVINGI